MIKKSVISLLLFQDCRKFCEKQSERQTADLLKVAHLSEHEESLVIFWLLIIESSNTHY